MPELPSILREGMSEVDYKHACDSLKPDIDNVTGVLLCRCLCLRSPSTQQCFLGSCIQRRICGPIHVAPLNRDLTAGILNGLVKCKDLMLNGKVSTTALPWGFRSRSLSTPTDIADRCHGV